MPTSDVAERLRAWSEFLAEEGFELWRDARAPVLETSAATPVEPARTAAPAPTPAPPNPPETSELVPPAVPVPTSTPHPAPAAPPPGRELLDAVREDLGDCRRCKLSGGRTRLVFGEGNPEARLMFVGEGPGADEDRSGRPFVGAAGQLLDKMIAAMGLRREDVYIANVVKCRPPQNRDPEPDEAATCLPFLHRQVRSVSPEVLVTLGKPAARWLLGHEGAISRIRGQWQTWEEIPVMPTFHPAFLLREPAQKKAAWADLQAVMAKLGLGGGAA